MTLRKPLPLKQIAAAVAVLAASCRPSVAQTLPTVPPPPPLPTGMRVVAGSATASQSGNQLTVANTPNTVLDWRQFSIGSGHGVYFKQNSATSQVLNRVTGQDPSTILGNLSSNGRVWLLNPNGVLFGQNARVDVSGLVASSLGLNLPEFLRSGTAQLRQEGSSAGSVVNLGSIRTPFGGHVLLAAPAVSNSGSIQAPGGSVGLAAATSVDVTDTALPNLGFRVNTPAGEAANTASGTVSARQVDMYGGVVNQQGVLHATTVGTDEQGRVVLRATGAVDVGGKVDASNPTGPGGSIDVTGRTVTVQRTGELAASGATQGGKVVLWSDDATNVHGRISARGDRGDGGFVETSTHGQLNITQPPDAGSTQGKPGTWLIDPHNITIQATGPDANVTGGPPPATISTTADSAVVTTGTITTALNAGTSVTIATSAGGTQAGDITVASPISVTTPVAGPTPSLTLNAHNNINIDQNITALPGGGALNVNLNAATGGSPTANSRLNASVETKGGTLTTTTDLVMNNNALIGASSLVGTGRTLVVNGPSATLQAAATDMAVTVNTGATLGLSTIDFTQPVALNGGTLAMGSATETMTASGGMTSTGGVLRGGGTFVVPAGQTFQLGSSGTLTVDADTTLRNQGTLSTQGQSISLNANSNLNNSGTVRHTGSLVAAGISGAGTLNNTGAIDATGAAGFYVSPATFTSTDGSFTQTGLGRLTLSPNTANYGGTTTLSGNGIDFAGGSHTFTGPLALSGAGTGLNIIGAVNLNQGASYTQPIYLDESGSLHIGAGQTLNALGGFSTTGGNLSGGTLVIPLGQSLNKIGSGTLSVNGTLKNDGTINWSDGFIRSDFAGGMLQNSGTIRYTGSNPVMLGGGTGNYTNSGAIEATSDGKLTVNPATLTSVGATYDRVALASTVGAYNGTTTLTGSRFVGGTHNFIGPLDTSSQIFLYSGSKVNLSQGANHLGQIMVNDSELNLPPGQTLIASGGMNLLNSNKLGGGGIFIVPTGQVLTKIFSGDTIVDTDTTLTNQGTFEWLGGLGGINILGTLNNSGTFRYFPGSGLEDRVLGGTGTFNNSGTVENPSPARLTISPATLTSNNATYSVGYPGGSLAINPTTGSHIGTTTLSGDNIHLGGTQTFIGPLQLSGAGTQVNVDGGTVNLNQGANFTGAALNLNGGTLNVAPGQTLFTTSVFTTTGGTLGGGGTFVAGGSLTKTSTDTLTVGTDTTLNVPSPFSWSDGNIDLIGTLNIGQAILVSGSANRHLGGGTGTLINSGTVNYGGTGSLTLDPATLTSTGSNAIYLESNTGNLVISPTTGTHSGTTILVGDGINLGGTQTFSGPLQLNGPLNVVGGTINLNQGANYTQGITLDNGSLNVAPGQTVTAGGGISTTGGTLGGGGTFVVPVGQNLTKTGTSSLGIGTDSTLNNQGTLNWADGTISVAGTLRLR